MRHNTRGQRVTGLTVFVEEEGAGLLVVQSLQGVLRLLVAFVEILELVVHQLLQLQLVLCKCPATRTSLR